MEVNKIYQGDCLEVLKTFPDESIDAQITSPPYWGLRDYGVEGQLGLEPDFNDFLKKLWAIFDEVKRVLKKDGVCWVNFGDTYSGGVNNNDSKKCNEAKPAKILPAKILPAKTLCMIPERFALGMVERGWILRNKIIWSKPNHMPSSVKDRFSNSWEYMFMFSRSRKYYFDLDAVREKHAESSLKNAGDLIRGKSPSSRIYLGQSQQLGGKSALHPSGKNPGDSWTITTQSFPEAHFAVFPEKLVERPVKVTPRWICNNCGKPRERIVESKNIGRLISENNKARDKRGQAVSNKTTLGDKFEHYTIGWTDCNCQAGFHPAVVMDIFAGSGTTCVVAKKHGRDYIGIELNPKYIEIAKKRLEKVPIRLEKFSKGEEKR